ncbi:MAG: hypothetical protein WBC70_05715 [Candidatus Aminicenantales bacterium]
MKPFGKFLLLGLLFSAAFLSAGSAEGLEIKIQAVAGVPTKEYLDTCVGTGFGFAIPLERGLSLSFDAGCWKSNLGEAPAPFYDGRLRAFPLSASLYFFPLCQKAINPCVFLGGSYVFSSFTMQDIITIPEITIDQSIKNGLCFRAGFGIDARISRVLGIFMETGYFYRETKGIATIADLNFGTSTQEIPLDLSALIFQIGIKYFIE